MNAKVIVVPIIIVGLLAAMIWYLARPQVESYGVSSVESTSVEAVTHVDIGEIDQSHVGRRVAFEGTITRECPHSGCWAIVQDASGQIRIDTNDGGFALPLRREGSKVRVVGKVIRKENGDLEIAAESAEL
jgi:uncharacterized protein YdeI (BOF family)